MSEQRLSYALILAVIVGLFLLAGQLSANARFTPATFDSDLPSLDDVATPEELAKARAEWLLSEHAQTYDDGIGANTTCARCKSPRNWDPTQDIAAQEALNCSACKRIPGAPRPDLASGIPVALDDWEHIGCDICHIPVGESFTRGIVFWNQASAQYEPVASVMELCQHCHEGRHGFQVIEEQEASPAHQGWECTRCHGTHGDPERVTCEGCHDPMQGSKEGVEAHESHLTLNCTACHDAGQLSIWYDDDEGSNHYGEYIPVRFAHALTSWPSHNLQLEVTCERCHHPRTQWQGAVAAEVGCEACHEEGAVLFWCVTEFMPRDPDPNAGLLPATPAVP